MLAVFTTFVSRLLSPPQAQRRRALFIDLVDPDNHAVAVAEAHLARRNGTPLDIIVTGHPAQLALSRTNPATGTFQQPPLPVESHLAQRPLGRRQERG